VLSLAAIATACKSPERKAAEETAKNLQEASKQMETASKNAGANMGDAMAAMGAAVSGAANGNKKVETVDYKELKALLPGGNGSVRLGGSQSRSGQAQLDEG